MEWWLALLAIMGGLVILMAIGLPVAFCFILVNMVAIFFLWGGETGLAQFILSVRSSVSRFSLLCLPLFILMGEVMFRAGIAPLMLDTMDKWLGRLPGRLGLLAVSGGTLFSTLTGTSMASVAMLGEVLVPEMEKRGYKKPMSLGPILGSGGLAMMIPPSGLAVLLGFLGEISIGALLVAIIIPGLVMAVLYASYIIGRCKLQPSIAPPYDVASSPFSEKLLATARYILPIGFIIFLVVGLIFLGVATPTEAAATGAIGCFILAAFYGRLNWQVVKESFTGTIRIAGMIFLIIVAATSFSQVLAYSGATKGLVEFALSFPVAPVIILIIMQVLLLILGAFMEVVSIMMITVPLFMPIVLTLGFDPVWFAVVYLLNMEMATTTPPFGLSLFVMKGVAPPDTTMGDIYRAALPFLVCDGVAMVLLFAFPSIALWLPELMR